MKLIGFLIVVKDIKEAERYYHDLFGLKTLQDNDGNMILSDGLFLQEEKYWRGFIGKDVIPQNNACELYFEEENVDAFYEKLKTLYPETKFVNLPMTHSGYPKFYVDKIFLILNFDHKKRRPFLEV